MTEELLKKGQALRNKIRFAKTRIRDFMQDQERCRYNPVKEDYFAGKVRQWTTILDKLRKEFKEL